jgi:hypothetical protein
MCVFIHIQVFFKCGIENGVTLYHLVFGYKIFKKSHYDFNYFLTIIGFSIYKAYYTLEQKTNRLGVYSCSLGNTY